MTAYEQWKRAAQAVLGVFDGVGNGGARRTALAQETALVEMMVTDVRDGLVRPPSFLLHPAHLPDGPDLQRLVAGDAAKDQQLRLDAHEWAAINRRSAGQGAVVLRNAIIAIRTANELLDDPDANEELHTWMHAIEDHIREAFSCDPRQAPHERDQLELWCVATCNKANPVPEWLQYWNGPRTPSVVAPPTPKQFVGGYHERGDNDD